MYWFSPDHLLHRAGAKGCEYSQLAIRLRYPRARPTVWCLVDDEASSITGSVQDRAWEEIIANWEFGIGNLEIANWEFSSPAAIELSLRGSDAGNTKFAIRNSASLPKKFSACYLRLM